MRGACPWVGRSRWNFGSYHLWGDVPALMPMTKRAAMKGGGDWFNGNSSPAARPDRYFKNDGLKLPGNNSPDRWSDREVARLKDYKELNRNPVHELSGQKGIPHRSTGHWTNADENGTKAGAAYRGQCSGWGVAQYTGSKSKARKAASAAIAKIPFALSKWVASVYYPKHETTRFPVG